MNEYQRTKLNNFLRESTLATAKAYQMKTGFDTLWKVQPKAVEPLLNVWIENALQSALKPFERLVNTLKNHYKGIVESMKTGITKQLPKD